MLLNNLALCRPTYIVTLVCFWSKNGFLKHKTSAVFLRSLSWRKVYVWPVFWCFLNEDSQNFITLYKPMCNEMWAVTLTCFNLLNTWHFFSFLSFFHTIFRSWNFWYHFKKVSSTSFKKNPQCFWLLYSFTSISVFIKKQWIGHVPFSPRKNQFRRILEKVFYSVQIHWIIG